MKYIVFYSVTCDNVSKHIKPLIFFVQKVYYSPSSEGVIAETSSVNHCDIHCSAQALVYCFIQILLITLFKSICTYLSSFHRRVISMVSIAWVFSSICTFHFIQDTVYYSAHEWHNESIHSLLDYYKLKNNQLNKPGLYSALSCTFKATFK